MTHCPSCPCCKNWINDACIARNPLIRKDGRLTMRNDYCSHYDHITGAEFAVTANNHEANATRSGLEPAQFAIVDGGERGLRVMRPGPSGIADVTPWHEHACMYVPTGPLGDKFQHYALGLVKILRKDGFNNVTINGRFVAMEDLKDAPKLKALWVKRRKEVVEEDNE